MAELQNNELRWSYHSHADLDIQAAFQDVLLRKRVIEERLLYSEFFPLN